VARQAFGHDVFEAAEFLEQDRIPCLDRDGIVGRGLADLLVAHGLLLKT
jgi:hypothetical protein